MKYDDIVLDTAITLQRFDSNTLDILNEYHRLETQYQFANGLLMNEEQKAALMHQHRLEALRKDKKKELLMDSSTPEKENICGIFDRQPGIICHEFESEELKRESPVRMCSWKSQAPSYDKILLPNQYYARPVLLEVHDESDPTCMEMRQFQHYEKLYREEDDVGIQWKTLLQKRLEEMQVEAARKELKGSTPLVSALMDEFKMIRLAEDKKRNITFMCTPPMTLAV